ncbi:hypothetical protein scyTo_0000456 [Scyliorhinus torazame]|uniref:Uncharacterized protein n=1 Tax=Scyliorhinus torazame TaxID=75743 RepID=A0A401NXX8_SCYTO|nr:hypothetical protein [Scyliorhinus torazame]
MYSHSSSRAAVEKLSVSKAWSVPASRHIPESGSNYDNLKFSWEEKPGLLGAWTMKIIEAGHNVNHTVSL